MAIYSGYVSSGADDYDDIASGNTTIVASDSTITGVRYAYAEVTTSGLTEGVTLNSATLYWNHVSYSKDKNDTFYRGIYTISGGVSNLFFSDTNNPGSAGWHSAGLDATSLTHINADEGSKTRFRFIVGETTYSTARTWTINAYENSPTVAAYLVVDYTEPSTGMRKAKRFIVIG